MILYSSDYSYGLDYSELVSYDVKGFKNSEISLDDTFYCTIAHFDKNIIIPGYDHFSVIMNENVRNYRYSDTLSAYPSSKIRPFKYKEKLFWVMDSASSKGKEYYTYVYDATNNKYLKINNGAPYGAKIIGKYCYLCMSNDWKTENNVKSSSLKIVKIDLDKFIVARTSIENIPIDDSVDMIMDQNNSFSNKYIFFRIIHKGKTNSIDRIIRININDGSSKNICILNGLMKKFGISKPFELDSSFSYNKKLYFFTRQGTLFSIENNDIDKYSISMEKVKLKDFSSGTMFVNRIIKKRMISIYVSDKDKKKYIMAITNLNNWESQYIQFESPKYAFNSKIPKDVEFYE